jgi:hypothetical protein
MLTAVFLILVVAGTYFYATQQETTQPSWSELSDEAKLDYLAEQESKREADRAENRAELYGESIYCARIDDDSLRNRCYDELRSEANTSQPTTTNTGASTLEPLQDVSANDEQRYNRAELYGDITYCDEITDEDLRLYCYEEISS